MDADEILMDAEERMEKAVEVFKHSLAGIRTGRANPGLVDSLRVEVLITGHTHMPMCIHVERGCVVNPGSLYQFNNMRSSSHSYGVLCLPEMTFELFDLALSPDQPVPIES